MNSIQNKPVNVGILHESSHILRIYIDNILIMYPFHPVEGQTNTIFIYRIFDTSLCVPSSGSKNKTRVLLKIQEIMF